MDKQAERRKWSSLCIWMARANVQKAREEARAHSISLPPPRGMGLLDLSFPSQISVKLTKPCPSQARPLPPPRTVVLPTSWLEIDAEGEGF